MTCWHNALKGQLLICKGFSKACELELWVDSLYLSSYEAHFTETPSVFYESRLLSLWIASFSSVFLNAGDRTRVLCMSRQTYHAGLYSEASVYF